MKKVIDGKRYDTATATKIGDDSRFYCGDFRYRDETLYKTPRGRFFLAGEGGPMSRWARHEGNMSIGGSGIIALDADDALYWCERAGIDADVIEKHFDIKDA